MNIMNIKDNINDIQTKNKEYYEINELKKELNKEKLKNKDLEEKINILEEKLKNEKIKNNNLKDKINKLNENMDNLKIELDEEIEKNKILEKNLEKEKMSKDNSKISMLYEKIFEKENEIKELKLKLSRFPFELNKGEKLMSIIFTSLDQKIHHSIICKNTDKFNYIENKLYKSYPEYQDNENFFTVNGIKINKSKSLEENKIRNNNIIILNIVE